VKQANQDNSGTPLPDAEIPQQRPWRRRWQVYASVGWSSFLAACFATMLFFAFVDPAEYQWMAGESPQEMRMTGYALGFFFFWFITAITGMVVAFLIRSTRREARRRKQDRTSVDG
jgi:TRAP-type C4-dicarboxylate transport system permease small subunit